MKKYWIEGFVVICLCVAIATASIQVKSQQDKALAVDVNNKSLPAKGEVMSKTEEQSQKQWNPNKCVTILALLATIAAAIAAIFSTITTSKAQNYIEKLNRSKISLQDKKNVTGIIKDDKVILEFEYTFKIIGQEPVEILNMKIGNFKFKTNEFTVVEDNYSLVNKQFPEGTFRHTLFLTFTALETGLPKDIIKEKISDWIGAQVIIFSIEYRSGEREKSEVKFYSIFRGSALYSLSNREYKQIESFLPQEFRQ
jgi:hypothetical protein